ncbi:hypothetical protein [Bergeyella sp. RCAD1439]|uniref:hypothetical protein n=1 Tax=Bergeyella anatis TaxID=3113737 RepID=UPI002E19937F|nr:hypothetical protein [Bergeyella sp. RCAD1439]
MTIFNLFSCKEEIKKYYVYGTKEYQQREKQLKIDTKQAAQMFAKYFFEKYNDKNEIEVNLRIIYDDYYIFSDGVILYNHKIGEYFLGNTTWVNGNTGEIFNSDKEKLNINLPEPSTKDILDGEKKTYFTQKFYNDLKR